ncbi:MAG TPA: hypothetical protein VMF35_15030 [Acidimicrobiales bacterium]|nr:hypothetical protein [Acidimicrobiales bacterium]
MDTNGANLAPDGFGWRARIGVLTHDDNTVSESELWTMAPEGVSLHAARIPFTDLSTYADPPGPENAADLLARLSLASIIYAWTVGCYFHGRVGEQDLVTRVEKHSNGVPVVMSASAAAAGFRALGAERIALVHAPFFSDDFDQKGVAYFRESGFDVVHASHLLPPIEVPHPNLGEAATPARLYEWVRANVPSSAQAVFIGGNGFRAIGVIAALEQDLGRPVLTANQASLWYAVRQAGSDVSMTGYGRLLTSPCR